jgi:hypothetical protein
VVRGRLRRVAAVGSLLVGTGCGPANLGPGPGATPTPEIAAPLIVQVENAPVARPVAGLNGATLVYEYVAEGGLSRFSAVFAAPPSGRVGPVRSARIATLGLLRLYGGALLYSGASTYITSLLAGSGLPHFDEDTARGALFRVAGRAPPHNLYTDGQHMGELLSRVDLPPQHYWFPSARRQAAPGSPASSFQVHISGSEAPIWTWDAGRGAWVRREPDTGAAVDADTGLPMVAGTVIVQQVHVAVAPEVEDVNGAHGVSHTLSGSGAAQVFVAGRVYAARWTQPATGPPLLSTGGRPAPIGSGAIWFELVATGSPATVTA